MKQILFVIPFLGMGGAEKSLIELLKQFDYELYKVDLLVFKIGGILEAEVPQEVNIISLNNFETLLLSNGIRPIKELIKQRKFIIAFKRIVLGILNKIPFYKTDSQSLLWYFFNKYFSENLKYDIAISYLQGISSYYTIDKILAEKKIVWIHSDYSKYSKNIEFDKSYIRKFDYIISVSKAVESGLADFFPDRINDMRVFYNLIDENGIKEKSLEIVEFDYSKFNIVSVGRLHFAKGFDLVIPAIKKLKDLGYNPRWSIVGEGPERSRLEKMISEYKLEDSINLLGLKPNPYPYIKNSDIYLQSSRYEGYCITLAEALILNKPIVTTDFSGAKEQVIDRKTGMIIKSNTADIFHALKKLIDSEDLREYFSRNSLKSRTKSHNSQLSDLYELFTTNETGDEDK